ncbi:SAM-dependent methyltransferase [Parabacteroides sp. PF5-6]|uniref:THUMP-like domain-containing protein n=1 Tax=Parabacteroides sp. PF5-6 TaxID=1742403 RepID=UPI002406297A|nr:SAM-dependent methyltransferase [Parabacteroides sp. PF5-6]MDF9831018.1 hypothetical protein [Parabacteroides sp. PF5-6]
MKLDLQTKAFIREHGGDDLSRLLLSASRYPEVDMPFVVDQIAARRQIRDKLPSWYAFEDLIYPSRLAAEQCSSEQTARYKQRLVNAEDLVCDLTGGLGVDSHSFSQKAKEVLYIERFENYAEAARHNMAVLGARNIQVRQGDTTEMIAALPDPDVFYIDPARRGESNKRLFALEDCEPDLLTLLPDLLKKAPQVIAKISPMADIDHTLKLLPQTAAVHVLSVRNECKELLFVIEREPQTAAVPVSCMDFNAVGEERTFRFMREEEQGAQPVYANTLRTYLYEPNASVMKAGAFKSIAVQYDMEKLGMHSHLYTSDRLIDDFPGRTFEIREVIPFQHKTLKTLSRRYPKANITVRNFPLTVEELRRRTGIREGGDVYLFATLLADGQKVILEGQKKG